MSKRTNGCIVATTLLGVVLMAGCESTDVKPMRTDYFNFTIAAVRTGGAVTNIDVTPDDDPVTHTPPPGAYNGGHMRIEANGAIHATVIWKSSEPFWIKFEEMLSSGKHNGALPCEDDNPTTYVKAAGAGPYQFECKLKQGGGRATKSTKYFLTVEPPPVPPGKPDFELDPIIIVDR